MQMMTYMDIALQNAQRLGLSNEIKPVAYCISMYMMNVSVLKTGENWKMML